MKLSVLMITYNHEKYVGQAIESALSQRTDFEYEIVVGEDCSTDGTRAVVETLQRSNPGKVRLLPPGPNLGMVRNFVRTYQACSGEYVALLDGDDYWTSEQKLQKQVDFLDVRPDCVMCAHLVEVRDEVGVGWPAVIPRVRWPEWTLEEHLDENHIPSCSVVVRNRMFGEFPEWFSKLNTKVCAPDWPFHALNAQYGKIALLPEVMGVYRVHPGGNWSVASELKKDQYWLQARVILNMNFIYKYDHIIIPTIVRQHYYMALNYMREYDYNLYKSELSRARAMLLKHLAPWPPRLNRYRMRTLRLAARVFCPALLHKLLYKA